MGRSQTREKQNVKFWPNLPLPHFRRTPLSFNVKSTVLVLLEVPVPPHSCLIRFVTPYSSVFAERFLRLKIFEKRLGGSRARFDGTQGKIRQSEAEGKEEQKGSLVS